jgi:hypothetical protein
VAAAAGAVGLTGIAPSFAGTINATSPIQNVGYQHGDLLLNVVQKKYKKKQKRYWRYNSRKHGKRYRARHPGYTYYYGGYWYPRPFWRFEPGIYLNLHL